MCREQELIKLVRRYNYLCGLRRKLSLSEWAEIRFLRSAIIAVTVTIYG